MANLVCPDCGESVRDFFSHRCMRAKSSKVDPVLVATSKHPELRVSSMVVPEGDGTAGSNPATGAKSKRAVRGTFDRKAYQREYMRKRRQKQK